LTHTSSPLHVPLPSGLQPYRQDHFLFLDEVTRRSLELTRTLREGSRDGSLLSALDRTVTAMGARMLHDWLLAPLAQRPIIEARLDRKSTRLNSSHQII